ncbi:MAG: DUF4118 domain-containing protein, partial [Clostridia bacterium]|nr:DUF4118 domain-containing protein [Clostridia bacterium]
MESRARKESAEHILVCLSASPSNQKVIEAASRMAKAFRASLTALYVMPSDGNALPEADEARLRSNIRLAERCGAVITTITGDDIPLQIAEYARISGITRIVIGRSSTKRAALFGRPSLTDQLILTSPDTDIYIIPDSAADLKRNAAAHRSARHLVPSRKDILYILGLLAAATAIGFLFEKLGFSESNIITVYILAVLGISVLTVSRVSSAVSSLAGVLLFNYFFIEPRFSFHTYEAEYAVTFIVMFAASVITGTLASRLKANETRSAHEAFRAKVLFDTNQRLQKAGTAEEIRRVTAEQVTALLSRNIIIYAANGGFLDDGTVFTADQPEERSHFFEDKERAAAEEALRQGSRTGAGTDTFPDVLGVYYAIRLGEKRFGVLGILPGRPAPEPFESSMVLSILGECALALENLRNAEEREKAAVLAQNEQLRANILRTIS